SRRDRQTALEYMELWRERKEALPEYIKHVAEEEKAWFEREAAANDKALRCMRSLMPVGVTGLTVSELEQRAMDGGSLYPRDLSLRLKENRLLQWTVMHPEDIARSNFLQGAHAHFFTNLDKYDLVEMRAVMACLPAKFEVDDDGRKAAWRAEFVQRAKGLVAQERGDTVSGGWDPKISARRRVRLPELSAGQTRREEYFYPTAEKVQSTVDKLRERQRKLEAKRVDLAKVRDKLLPEARREYDFVLEDTRHPVNRAARTPEELRSAREEAKSEVTRLSKETKRLEGEVASAARALRESPSTVEGTLKEAAATRRLLSKRSRKLLRLSAKRHTKEAATSATATATASSPPAPACEKGGQVGAEAEAGSAAEEEQTEAEEVQEEDEQKEEEEEELEVEAGSLVAGAFDPTPELKSRLNDSRNSLRFVTADEEARIRKDELAMVFSFSGRCSGTTGANGVSEEHGSSSSSSGGGDDTGCDEEAGERASADRAGSDSGLDGGGGNARSRVKAFGAMLESTLSKTLVSAPAPSGSTGPTRRASCFSAFPPRPERESNDKRAATIADDTPWEPKSKHFRSLQPANGSGAGAGSGGPRSLGGLPPPPPAPMLGMLSQIRARGNNGGSRSTGCLRPPAPPPPPPAPMLGMLSEIRARGGSASARGDGGAQSGGGQAPAGMDGLLAEIRSRRR
ncbi:unnamed protein product, partial [Ectocarpus fasciculatus]